MRLSDIVNAGNGGGNIRDTWNNTAAAGDFGPLPTGEYIARIIAGEFKQSKSNSTPGYSLTFEVVEPAEHRGRKFWHDCWLTPAAIPQSKRDLGKIGVVSLEQLDRPIPLYFICKCKLALRRDDDGNEVNRLKSFEVLRREKPEADPFAPAEQVDAPELESDETPEEPDDTDSTSDSFDF